MCPLYELISESLIVYRHVNENDDKKEKNKKMRLSLDKLKGKNVLMNTFMD